MTSLRLCLRTVTVSSMFIGNGKGKRHPSLPLERFSILG